MLSVRSIASRRAAVLHPAQQRSHSLACRANRETWYPGAEPPSYLDGSLAGDRGFDPLRMGANKDALAWYREGELYNGRVAMMGVVGILFTDAVGLPKWWLAGAEKYALDTKTLILVEVLTFAILEYKRYDNFKTKGQTGFLGMAPFDPAGLDSEKMQEREVKNGRLAMLAFVGFASQAAVRGKGPIDCLRDHIADPGHVNICTSSVGVEVTVATCLLAFMPIIFEARKSVGDKDENKEGLRPIPW